MPVVRRERHRSNSSSPKLLPSRTLSPRNAAAATGHRFLQLHHHSHHHHSGSGGFTATASSSGMGGSTGGSEPAKLASSSSSSSSSSVRAEIYAPLPPPILTTRNNNNNPSASTSSSPDSSSSNGSPSSSSMLFSQSSSSSHPSLGMSLRNHTRNILSEQQQQQRSAREDLMPPGGGAGRRLRGVDFRDMDYASSSNSDLTTTRGAAAGTARQMYPSQSSATSSSSSSSASSSGNNNHLHSHQAGLPASSRSDPCIRLLADVPDDFAEEKGSRRKRRRLMDMIDTNVPSNHPGMSLYEFIGPDFVDHFSAPLPPVNSSSHVGVAMSSASTSSSLGAHNRAPSRLSSSSSSSDGTNGGPSSGNHRVRRLSSRRKRVADLQNPPIYNVNGHLVQMQPHHHPGVPYPPGVAFGHAFCQAHALGHACSANHVHMNAATGSISAVPHLCCNVAMCPMQQQRATGHAGSVVGGAGYPGMGYASSGQQQQQQQQQQQIHPNSSQSTRHSQQQQQQSMNQSMPSSQPHRTSQPYLPSDMLPGSHPYRTTPASYSQMIAASMQQQQDQQTNAHRLSHSHSTGSLPSSQQQHVLSGSSSAAAAAVRQQYSRHPGQASSESMAMYGAALSEMAAVAAGGGGPTWVSRRRMTENVTPATHLSQQNAAAGVRINSGVPFMTYDSGYFHHFQLARANQNSMSVGGPGYPYGAGQMDMSGHPHEHEQYELMLNIADRLNCESKPKGLTKQEIEKIRLRRFSGEKTDHGQTACVICICDFEPKQSLRQLPCTHEFHAKCVDKWLKSNRSCPICRGDASVYMKKSKLH